MPFFPYVYCCYFCTVLLFILFFLPSHPYQSVFVYRTFYHHLFCSLSFFLPFLHCLVSFFPHLSFLPFTLLSPLIPFSFLFFIPFFFFYHHFTFAQVVSLLSLFYLFISLLSLSLPPPFFLSCSFLLFSSCHSLLSFYLSFLFTLLIVTYVVSSILPSLTFCLFPFVFLYSCPSPPSLSPFYYFFHLPFLPFLLLLPVHIFTSSFDFDLPSYYCSFHSSLRLPTLFPNFLPLFPPFFIPALNFIFLVSFFKYIFLSFSVFPCCYCDLLFLIPSILPSFLHSFNIVTYAHFFFICFSFLVISILLIVTCVVPFFHSFSLFTCFSFFLPPFFLNLSCSQVILHTRTNTQHN